MTPAEKAEISRRNGQLSEGPTSAEGKRIVSRNALKHGFASETIPVKSEEQTAYTRQLQSWVDQLRPNGLIELTLVERICRNSWKLEKIAEREDEVLDLRSSPWPTTTSRPPSSNASSKLLHCEIRGRRPSAPFPQGAGAACC